MRFYVNCQNICFNTTFVTVLLESPLCLLAYTDRFNTTFVTVLLTDKDSVIIWNNSFNTTFVTVLLCSGIYGASDCSVSIQLLLLFYITDFFDQLLPILFQYNFCYCSIRIFTGFLFYYITRYPLKIKIF